MAQASARAARSMILRAPQKDSAEKIGDGRDVKMTGEPDIAMASITGSYSCHSDVFPAEYKILLRALE